MNFASASAAGETFAPDGSFGASQRCFSPTTRDQAIKSASAVSGR